MKLMQSFIIAFAMYSKIPMPRADWNEENMRYVLCFFPAIGIVIGVLQYILGRILLHGAWGNLFFAAAMTLLPLLISGGIHMDGFMDTMDALGSYGDREKKLAILKDSHSGAFAILGLGCYLVWSLGVWSEAREEMLGVIACSYVVSRACSGFAVVTFPSAREKGLVKTFKDGAREKAVQVAMVLYFCAAAGVMLWVNLPLGAGALAMAVIVFGYYRHVCMSQFGGVTGDLAGYFLQMCELAMLTGIVLVGHFVL